MGALRQVMELHDRIEALTKPWDDISEQDFQEVIDYLEQVNCVHHAKIRTALIKTMIVLRDLRDLDNPEDNS